MFKKLKKDLPGNVAVKVHSGEAGNQNYLRPEFEIFEVAVEGGYGDSVLLPGFGTENDELVY